MSFGASRNILRMAAKALVHEISLNHPVRDTGTLILSSSYCSKFKLAGTFCSGLSGDWGRHLLTLTSRNVAVIKIVPKHNILKALFAQRGIHEMFPLRSSDPFMNFPSRLPTKESSHFPIDKSHNLVVINDTIGLGEVIMHKA